MRNLFVPLAALLAIATACDGPIPVEQDPNVELLSPVERLSRVSMALKGTRPTLDELNAVRADPDALESLVDAYLDSEEFGLTVREMHDDALQLGVSPVFFPAGFPALPPLDRSTPEVINKSVIEAPFRLIEKVVTEGRPYSEIVTADYTLANGPVATVWGLPYEGAPESTEWQETEWTDGRATAGILSDSWMWTRHASTDSNKNRGRANVISRGLLCSDFMAREIPLDATIDLADRDAVADALNTNPSCVSCHQALDPLAGHFTDFIPIFVPQMLAEAQLAESGAAYPVPHYSPFYRGITQFRDPGYFGAPQSSLDELGASIAADPRFSKCAVERFYGWFHQIEPADVPLDVSAELQTKFIDGGMNARQLIKDIVLADDFSVAHVRSDAHALASRGVKRANPYQQARMVEELTGYRWVTNFGFFGDDGLFGFRELDMLTEDFVGYRVIAGGTDANVVTEPLRTTTGVSQLFSVTFAGRAADFAIQNQPTRVLSRGLVDDEANVRATLADLYLRVLAEEHAANGPEIDAAYALFQDALVETEGDVGGAWTLVLTALLSDMKAQFY
jgi:hypothetical protein